MDTISKNQALKFHPRWSANDRAVAERFFSETQAEVFTPRHQGVIIVVDCDDASGRRCGSMGAGMIWLPHWHVGITGAIWKTDTKLIIPLSRHRDASRTGQADTYTKQETCPGCFQAKPGHLAECPNCD